ncbi:RagB/SusD family nutrient uptake outer membrane protein [Puteibacter caeruleilacunae]|nr:RagB/SusD family nutrient uptake outer membrane protein [Puteibacter caeruleilacunae]
MKRIVILMVAVIMFSSCESWLELKPENALVKEEFWQTQADVEAILTSCYKGLQDNVYELVIYGELRSDQLDTRSIDTNARRIREGNISSTNTYAKWGFLYEIINNANAVIENAPKVVEIDPNFDKAELSPMIAEAKFMRSLAYFYLVRVWREVPILAQSYETDNQELTVKKSTEEEILDYIITDLVDAIPNIKTQYVESWEKWGRGTRTAAQALLADVYLWKGDYQKSIEQCDLVLADPFRGLMSTELWFSIFSEGNTNEGIFEVQFDKEYNQTGPWNALYYNNVSPDFLYPAELKEEPIYEDDDVRGVEGTYETKERRILKFITATPEKPQYYSGKEFDCNFIVYRLAEIYLMKAEALAVLGEYEQAQQQVERIQARAGLVSQLDIPRSKEGFEDFILMERQREFTGEGKAWFDLLRVAKRNNFERKDLLIEKLLLYVDGTDRATIQQALQNPYAYYLPIHEEEIKRNSELVQNPYYEN